MRIFGIFWALLILMLNTGSEIDRKRSKWYADTNDLTTCLNLTFCIVIILIAISFVVQFVRQNTSDGGINFRNISFLGFMGLVPEQWEKVDHLSYEIER